MHTRVALCLLGLPGSPLWVHSGGGLAAEHGYHAAVVLGDASPAPKMPGNRDSNVHGLPKLLNLDSVGCSARQSPVLMAGLAAPSEPGEDNLLVSCTTALYTSCSECRQLSSRGDQDSYLP